MFDVLIISARSEDLIYRSLRNYHACGLQPFIARHPSSPALSSSLVNELSIRLIQQPEILFHRRLHQLLRESSSDFVLLAADDDFLVNSNIPQAFRLISRFPDCVSLSIQTLNIYREEGVERFTLSPYLNSAFVYNTLLSSRQCTDIFTYFSPLNIDFYTIYNRKKLLHIFDILDSFLSFESWNLVDQAGKVLQYILAFATILSGRIIPFVPPIYVRGDTLPMRKNPVDIDSGLISKNEQLSYDQELKQILNHPSAFSEIVESLSHIYLLSGHNSPINYPTSISHCRSEIRNDLKTVLVNCSSHIKLNFLQSFQQNYKIIVENSLSKPQIFNQAGCFNFHLASHHKSFVNRECYLYGQAWQGFILNNINLTDLDRLGLDYL